MQTVLKRLRKNSPAVRQAHRLYRAAFPENERAPFFLLMHRAEKRLADWWSIYDDGKWVGFAYVVCDGTLAYVFYFAVDAAARGKGCGSRALTALRTQYSHGRLFLAVESLDAAAENFAERVRRKQFYLRCGMEDLHACVREGDVIYDLLGAGGAVSGREYKRLIRRWAGPVLGRMITMKMLPERSGQEDARESM